MLLAPIANMARVVERVHDHVAILHQGTLLWCAFLHIKPRMASAKGGYHIQSPADFELCEITVRFIRCDDYIRLPCQSDNQSVKLIIDRLSTGRIQTFIGNRLAHHR
jgi:hypothetical protein